MLCLRQCTEDKLATLIFPVYFEVAFIYLPFVILSHIYKQGVTVENGQLCSPVKESEGCHHILHIR